MPKTEGLEILEQIAAVTLPELHQISIVLATGPKASIYDRLHSLACGKAQTAAMLYERSFGRYLLQHISTDRSFVRCNWPKDHYFPHKTNQRTKALSHAALSNGSSGVFNARGSPP